jgi:hypothetical protein
MESLRNDPALRAGLSQFAISILQPQRAGTDLGVLGSSIGAGGAAAGRFTAGQQATALAERGMAATESRAESEMISARAAEESVAASERVAGRRVEADVKITEMQIGGKGTEGELNRASAERVVGMQIKAQLEDTRLRIEGRKSISRAELEQQGNEFGRRLAQDSRLTEATIAAGVAKYKAEIGAQIYISRFEDNSFNARLTADIASKEGIAQDMNRWALLETLIAAESARVASLNDFRARGDPIVEFNSENVTNALTEAVVGLRATTAFEEALAAGDEIAATDEQVRAWVQSGKLLDAARLTLVDEVQVARIRAEVKAADQVDETVVPSQATASADSLESVSTQGLIGDFPGDPIAQQLAAVPSSTGPGAAMSADVIEGILANREVVDLTDIHWALIQANPVLTAYTVTRYGEEAVRKAFADLDATTATLNEDATRFESERGSVGSPR